MRASRNYVTSLARSGNSSVLQAQNCIPHTKYLLEFYSCSINDIQLNYIIQTCSFVRNLWKLFVVALATNTDHHGEQTGEDGKSFSPCSYKAQALVDRNS